MWDGTAFLGVGALAYSGVIGTTTSHRHAAHQILVARDGAVVYADLDAETVGPASSIAIPGGIAHALRPAEPGTVALTVYVDVDTAHGNTIGSLLAGKDPRHWVDSVEDITAGWPLPEHGDLDSVDGENLVAFLSAPVDTDGPDSVHPYVRAALLVVSENLSERLALSGVADAVNISVPHLSRLWRRDLGLSFNAWIRWIRLREAARLVASGVSITDAAHGAGFADGAHASRVCREMFGLSPLELTQNVVVI